MNDLPPESLTICLQLFSPNPLTNRTKCAIIYTVKGNTPREREETTMTTAIIFIAIAIIIATVYCVALAKSEDIKADDKTLADLGVDHEWWHAN